MEGDRGIAGGGARESKACIRRRAPLHTHKHGKSCIYIQEPGLMEGGRGTAGGGAREKNACIRRGAP